MPNKIFNQVKLICQTYDIYPARQRGQNFLINSEVIKKIIKAADLQKDDIVLEVGPGLGILTEELVRQAKKVISVELDKKLFNFLKAKFAGIKNLELINDDILNLKSDTYKLIPKTYKIVANLPYNITSHFLKKFLTAKNRPTEMTLLVQKEVAQRIFAPAGQMSLLSVSVQFYGQPKIIEIVGKENFWPKPEVDSAILKVAEILSQKAVDKYLGEISERFFWQIVKIGYAARRKQLKNNLAAGLPLPAKELEKLLKKANFDSKTRAQNLAVKDWLTLAKKINFYLN